MTITTLDRIDAAMIERAIEDEIDAYTPTYGGATMLRHEDGSVTVVLRDDCYDIHPLRDYEPVATFVNLRRDYVAIHGDDAGLVEAWERFEHDETKMRRYLAVFRPDILHFEAWEVQGCSQGDWQNGIAYVTRDALAATGYDPDDAGAGERANLLLSGELAEFAGWFAGDVYLAHHVAAGEPVVALGEHGAYVSSYDVDTDTLGGFIEPRGLPNGFTGLLRDVAGNFTASPVVDVEHR